jgi:tRNA A37 methylthiotransferase MiaB
MKLIDDVGFDASLQLRLQPAPRHAGRQPADDTPQEVKLKRLQHLQAHRSSRTCAHQRQPGGHGAAHPGGRPVTQGPQPN